jgi:hypothetical protein
LTADDFSFVVKVLGKSESDRVSLVRLLTDEDTRDAVLDHDALADAIVNSPERLPISAHLLFYVLCRKVLRDSPVCRRETSDYVASLLDGFMRTAQMDWTDESGTRSLRYISDMLAALGRADTREAFLIRAHIANHSLFLSGMFAEHVRKRNCERGAPDIGFYEDMGRMNFRAAAEYRDAKKFHVQSIFEDLADGFHEVRVALNDLASRLLHLDTPHPTIIEA